MKKRAYILKGENQEGAALITALLILALLTLIGISINWTTSTDVNIAGNERLYKSAFFAAEAGIEAGRAALNSLKVADSGSWDNLLAEQADANTQSPVTLLQAIDADGQPNVGRATFTLTVADNDDLDGDSLVDTDNIIILTSTGRYRNAVSQIEAWVRYKGSGDQYAQEHYDTGNSGNAAAESAVADNAQRW